MLADAGIDPDTARYILKRLYDIGFTARDTGPGDDPPATSTTTVPHPAKTARRAARVNALRTARAEVAAAREAKAAEIAAGISAEHEERLKEDRARERAAAVAKILSTIP